MTTLFADGSNMAERYVTLGGSGVEPEEGTREWFLLTRDRLKSQMNSLHSNRMGAKYMFERMESSGAWKLLNDPKTKRPFGSFDAFCLSRTGFGRSRATLWKRIAEDFAKPEGQGGVREARSEGGGRPKAGTEEGVSHTPLPKGTSAARIVARLKRDAPEVAKRLAAGEFSSARAAGIAAGIVKLAQPLTELRRWWKRASTEERKDFLSEVLD